MSKLKDCYVPNPVWRFNKLVRQSEWYVRTFILERD